MIIEDLGFSLFSHAAESLPPSSQQTFESVSGTPVRSEESRFVGRKESFLDSLEGEKKGLDRDGEPMRLLPSHTTLNDMHIF